MSPVFIVLFALLAVSQADLPVCGDEGHTCYYIDDPCPVDKEDCSDKYSCSLPSNKCCCLKTPKLDCIAEGHNCYYIDDPCPKNTMDCSDDYECSLETNKCCCKQGAN